MCVLQAQNLTDTNILNFALNLECAPASNAPNDCLYSCCMITHELVGYCFPFLGVPKLLANASCRYLEASFYSWAVNGEDIPSSLR